jgi:hypothetical protein
VAANASLVGDVIVRDHATKALKSIGDETKRTHSKFAAFAGALAGGALANLGVDFFKGGIADIKAAQAVSAQTATVIKTMGNAAGVSQAHVEGLADGIEKMSGLQAENVQAGENMLLTFDQIKGANFDRATRSMADMSARMGGDAVGAATMLGKALNDPAKGISALTRVGVSFTAGQQKSIKAMQQHGNVAGAQTVILKALEAQFGGSAKAAGETMGGKLEILKAKFGDVRQDLVTQMLPALTKLMDFITKTALPAIQKLAGFLERNKAVIVPLAVAIGTIVAAIKIWTAVQAALNFVMEANPIGLVVIAIAALAAGLIYAYKHSESFRNVVNGAFSAISGAASFMWNGVLKPTFKFLVDTFLAVAGAIVHGASKAFGWVPGIGGKLKNAAKAFDKFRDDVNKSLAGVKDKTVTLNVVTKGVKGATAATRNDRDFVVGARAGGGPVIAGRPYLVGEHEPEIYVPGATGRIYNSSQIGGGGDIHVHFHGPVLGGSKRVAEELVDEMMAAMRSRQRRGGLGPIPA